MKRIAAFGVLGVGLLWIVACSSDGDGASSSSSSGGGTSSGGASSGGTSSGGTSSSSSGGSSSGDGTSSGGLELGDVGVECVLVGNYGCREDLRCECEGDQADCTCQPGVRGTGDLNTPCTSGNDCVSALCVGEPGESHYCTVDCSGNPAVCTGALAKCNSVSGFCVPAK